MSELNRKNWIKVGLEIHQQLKQTKIILQL